MTALPFNKGKKGRERGNPMRPKSAENEGSGGSYRGEGKKKKKYGVSIYDR